MRTFNCVSRLFRLLPVFMGVVSVLQVHSAFGMSGSPEQRDSLFSVSDSTYRQVIREGARSMSCYLTYPQSRTQVLPDFENNASELRKLDEFIRQIYRDSLIFVNSVRLCGYCSIEGSMLSTSVWPAAVRRDSGITSMTNTLFRRISRSR